MGIAMGGINPALAGIKTHSRAFERATQRVTEASMNSASVRDGESTTGCDSFVGSTESGCDLPGAMVDVLVAQRAHSASISAMRVAHQMLRDVADLGAPLT